MELPHNIKMAKTSSIFVTTTLAMALKQNKSFLPLVMAKAHVMEQVFRTSLQMTSGQVISTPYGMFQWCQDNVSGISFFYVSSEDINNHVNQFQLDQTV